MLIDMAQLRESLASKSHADKMHLLLCLRKQSTIVNSCQKVMLKTAKKSAGVFTLNIELGLADCSCDEEPSLSAVSVPGTNKDGSPSDVCTEMSNVVLRRLHEEACKRRKVQQQVAQPATAEKDNSALAGKAKPKPHARAMISLVVTPAYTVADVMAKITARFGEKATRHCTTLRWKQRLLPLEATLCSLGIDSWATLELGYPTLQVNVITLTGKNIVLATADLLTVADLKYAIQTREGIPPDNQRLIFAGKQLCDEDSLSQRNICSGSVLHLVLRLRGGMFDPTSGRCDFEVLDDGIYFHTTHGHLVAFSRGLQIGGHVFASREEMIQCVEDSRVACLLRDLENSQTESEALRTEIAEWMPELREMPRV